MSQQQKLSAHGKLEALEMSEMLKISGGIWDYSNRLGAPGQQLEDLRDLSNGWGDLLGTPKNLDDAASRALNGWVSVP